MRQICFMIGDFFFHPLALSRLKCPLPKPPPPCRDHTGFQRSQGVSVVAAEAARLGVPLRWIFFLSVIILKPFVTLLSKGNFTKL